MDNITKWLTEKFQHPMVPLFFILGALLILIGVTNGIKLPWVDTTNLPPGSRNTALVLGLIFCGVSIALYYFPRPEHKPVSTSAPDSAQNARLAQPKAIAIPKELSLDFPARQALLSPNQESLLKYLAACCYPNKYISMPTIHQKFSQYTDSEVFYRLEQLRLLGFLETCQTVQGGNQEDEDTYGLSGPYQKALGSLRTRLPVPKPYSSRTLQEALDAYDEPASPSDDKNGHP